MVMDSLKALCMVLKKGSKAGSRGNFVLTDCGVTRVIAHCAELRIL